MSPRSRTTCRTPSAGWAVPRSTAVTEDSDCPSVRHDFGVAAQPAEEALANASRILPIVTTTHGASGSNNTYWPEMYTNMPIVDASRNQTYRDTPQPALFGNVSSFDPQLFWRIAEFDKDDGLKYSPLEVAQWLEDLADEDRPEPVNGSLRRKSRRCGVSRSMQPSRRVWADSSRGRFEPRCFGRSKHATLL